MALAPDAATIVARTLTGESRRGANASSPPHLVMFSQPPCAHPLPVLVLLLWQEPQLQYVPVAFGFVPHVTQYPQDYAATGAGAPTITSPASIRPNRAVRTIECALRSRVYPQRSAEASRRQTEYLLSPSWVPPSP